MKFSSEGGNINILMDSLGQRTCARRNGCAEFEENRYSKRLQPQERARVLYKNRFEQPLNIF